MRSRDTIQQYIDLWESASPSGSNRNSDDSMTDIPPPLPRKDTFRRPRRPGALPQDESVVLIEVTEKKQRERSRPHLEQIKTTWNHQSLRRRLSDSTIIEKSRFSPDTTVAGDTPRLSPYAGSFASIAAGNPFSTGSDCSSAVDCADYGIPFGPDDMWVHHKPTPVPAAARVSAMQSPRFARGRLRRHSSVVSRPQLADFCAEDVVGSPEFDVNRSTVGTSSVTSSAFFDLYDHEPFNFSSLTPRPPPSPARPPPSPARPSPMAAAPQQSRPPPTRQHSYNSGYRQEFEIDPPLSALSRIEGSPRSSIVSDLSDLPEKKISGKAALMLGIESVPLRRVPDRASANAPELAVPFDQMDEADINERYDVSTMYASHQRRTSQSSSSQNSRSEASWGHWSTSASHASTALSSTFSQMPYDATLDAACVWKALKKAKKPDTDLLTATLVAVSHEPYKVHQLRQKYKELYAEDLVKDLRASASGNYRVALVRLVEGPYKSEALVLEKHDSHFFMDDKLVAEALFGKNPDEIKLIKLSFEQIHGYSLSRALENLYLSNAQSHGTAFDSAGPSGWFGRVCIRLLAADREVERLDALTMMNGDQRLIREARQLTEVEDLYKPDRGSQKYLDQKLLVELITTRSDIYLAELSRKFYERHGREITELIIAKDRSKLMSSAYYPINLGYAIAYTLNGATNKPQRDAKLLADCMKGLSTNDDRLIARLVRIHYDNDPRHLIFVKDVYRQRYGRECADSIRKATRGAYRDLLLKILDGRSQVGIDHFL